jgi:hypothetical protein
MTYGSSSSSPDDKERDDAEVVKRVTSLFCGIGDDAARLPEQPKVI